ncbi:SOS response-associated peptidase [Chelatococcus sp. GCM10030263]|uniref:SOS response-associated peptidase n=1 Tax=Chelatococcus sp. GCM10030263 TaxID=3273387 RepID=UPI00360D3DFA
MCGRIVQASPSELLALGLVIGEGLQAGAGQPRFNGAPGQELGVVRRHPQTGRYHLDRLLWGLVPFWLADPTGGRRPINAKAETVRTLPSFREAYARRRCLLPVDGFFEWQQMGRGAKRPHAITMRDRAPFALAGLWENWRHPETGTWIRTFCVLTSEANSLISAIHHRMPVIIPPRAYVRWLSGEADPADLLASFPADAMALWPVSTRVNSPANDDAALLDPAADAVVEDRLL